MFVLPLLALHRTEMSMTDKKSKEQQINDILHKGHEAAEIGKAFAPPGVKGRIQDAEDAMEIAEAGIGVFARLKNLFKKKKP